MRELRRRGMLLGAAAALLATSAGGALAQQADGKTKDAAPLKSVGASERVAGVIVKVEPIKEGADPGSTISKEAKAGRQAAVTRRLTINTAAVWRNWARDQASLKPDASPKAAAAKGDESIATKGEPVDKDTIFLVDIGPESKVETRFRAPDDETSRGAETPAKVATDSGQPSTIKKGDSKTPQFKADDLKPGLFIEVDFTHKTAQNVARRVTVIRPVGGADTAPPAK